MKNFNLFVDEIVKQWRSEKKSILESVGLKGVSNREVGDSAEDYILRKVDKISPKYTAVKSKGSQTPADIFAVGNRGKFWHIMLIQVKSSKSLDGIYQLSPLEKKHFNEFAKFLKKQFNSSSHLRDYKGKSIIISTGYAGVYVDEKNGRHSLKQAEYYNSFKKNMPQINTISLLLKLALAHGLNPK